MKTIIRFLIILLTGIISLGCSHKPDSRLTAAESLMDSRPDSALMILDSIRPQTLRGDGDHALYALLLTQAQEKNWLNPKNDSLISSAVEYFKGSGDGRRYAIASHYQGRVRQLNNNYSEALISFYIAKEGAPKYDEYLIASMACRGIAEIYAMTYNSAEELEYVRKEYEYARKSGNSLYIIMLWPMWQELYPKPILPKRH